jgi:hypothetical protein
MRIVPVVLGEMLIGGWWQRPQLIAKRRSPEVGALVAAVGFGLAPPVPANSTIGYRINGRAATKAAYTVDRDIISSPAREAI